MLISDQSAPHTSAPSASATRVSSGWASENATPSPAMIIGRDPDASMAATSSMTDGAGAVRVLRRTDGTTSSSLGSSSTSIGSDTNTGPIGGVMASLIARRNTRSNDRESTT